jgi:hypothetical protein
MGLFLLPGGKSRGNRSDVKRWPFFVRPAAYLLPLAAYLIFPSCNKDEPAPDLGYTYFPDKVGHYVIYEVDSTAKDDGVGFDTTYRFQVKEVIQSIYTDNSGRPTMRLERYRKNYDPNVPYSQQTWTGPRIYSANLTNTTGERIEENIRYTRITFPVKRGTTWNANANNVLEGWESKFTSVHQPEIVNGFSFDSVATVKEHIDTNIVTYKFAVAKYAKNVGLVYRQLILLNRQPQDSTDLPYYEDTLGLPAYNILSQKAIIYTQRVIGWGD